jgi:hypothetical protein
MLAEDCLTRASASSLVISSSRTAGRLAYTASRDDAHQGQGHYMNQVVLQSLVAIQ